MESEVIRQPNHAGSWYTDDPHDLTQELIVNLSEAEWKIEGKTLKGLIGPHAGLRWSGKVAAWAYININPQDYDWVFLLGVAHKKPIEGAALSKASKWRTPIGDLDIDTDIVK